MKNFLGNSDSYLTSSINLASSQSSVENPRFKSNYLRLADDIYNLSNTRQTGFKDRQSLTSSVNGIKLMKGGDVNYSSKLNACKADLFLNSKKNNNIIRTSLDLNFDHIKLNSEVKSKYKDILENGLDRLKEECKYYYIISSSAQKKEKIDNIKTDILKILHQRERIRSLSPSAAYSITQTFTSKMNENPYSFSFLSERLSNMKNVLGRTLKTNTNLERKLAGHKSKILNSKTLTKIIYTEESKSNKCQEDSNQMRLNLINLHSPRESSLKLPIQRKNTAKSANSYGFI